jgi:hypothetical protein
MSNLDQRFVYILYTKCVTVPSVCYGDGPSAQASLLDGRRTATTQTLRCEDPAARAEPVRDVR